MVTRVYVAAVCALPANVGRNQFLSEERFFCFSYVLVVYFCSFKIRIRIRKAERKFVTNIPPN
jgi:hypothetical protein